jgi:hypothetical protein
MTQSLVQGTHRRSKSNSDDKNSQADPALARVASGLFGVCVVGISGRIRCAGDVPQIHYHDRVAAMRIPSQFPETKSFAFALPLTLLRICFHVPRVGVSKLPKASEGVFLRRAA